MEILDNERQEKKIDNGPKAMDSLLNEPIITLEEFFREFENRDFPVVGDGFVNLYSKNFDKIKEELTNGKNPLETQVTEIEKLVKYFEHPEQFNGKVRTSKEIAEGKYDTPEKIIQGYRDTMISYIEIDPDRDENSEELKNLWNLVKYFENFRDVIKEIYRILEENIK